jgi:preprotein translocase subunit Sss1
MTSSPSDASRDLSPAAESMLEEYLDTLAARLGLPRDGSRQVLVEATSHLYLDTEARMAAGSSPEQAAEAAIAAFGEPARVASALRSPGRQLLSTFWLFTGLGLVAIGLSGLLAAVFGAVRGWEFVAGDPAGLSYSAERCAQYLRMAPEAVTCRAAALVDHYAEVVDQRVVAGVIGIVVLAGYALWRRRGGTPASRLLLGGVGVACFGLAAITQLMSASTAASLDHGMVGALLAGGIVSLILALALVPVLVSGLRRSTT